MQQRKGMAMKLKDKTIIITAMILLILIGGTMFAGVFTAAGGLVGCKASAGQRVFCWDAARFYRLQGPVHVACERLDRSLGRAADVETACRAAGRHRT